MASSSIARRAAAHVWVGVFFLMVGIILKNEFGVAMATPWIQLPCAFFSSVLLPLGAFLSLRALIYREGHARSLLRSLLVGLFLPLMLAGYYFYTFALFSWTLESTLQPLNVLPQLVKHARTAPDIGKRERCAQGAYQLYGATLAYPREDGQVLFYTPTAKDEIERRKSVETEAKAAPVRELLELTRRQLLRLFALYVGTMAATFLAGGTWLFFRLPRRGFPSFPDSVWERTCPRDSVAPP